MVRDRTLIALVLLAAILNLGHLVDHFARGDIPWPPTMQSVPFIILTLAIYTLVGVGLLLYWNNKVGPRFWAIAATVGAVFAWLGHFSPFTDQPPRHIFYAYTSAVAGWLAVGCAIALMLTLVVAAIYAGYLWFRLNTTAALSSR